MDPSGMYRPGYPFTYVELQAMTSHKVLRHMIADVYAEARLPQNPALRAAAAHTLVNSTLRRQGVLCGETAAWVHLGTAPVDRVSMIAPRTGFRQVASAGRWQLHQIPVDPADVMALGAARVTSPLRTAADLFCGFGVHGCRKSLDRLVLETPGWDPTAQALHHWPQVSAPLQHRDADLVSWGTEDHQQIQQRWEQIRQLVRDFQLNSEQLADTVLGIMSRTSWNTGRRDRVGQLLTHWVSRRLPTVR